jgi:transposase-like protein
MATGPKTLQEAIQYFTDPVNCREYLMPRRWPNGVECPTCGTKKVSFLANQNRWQCSNKHSKRQFSIKVGTIFEDSPLGLDKWLPAVWFVTNCKNGISSYEIHRDLGVTQKTAWFMLHRIRAAMQEQNDAKLSGEIEADETFVGGKIQNMHKKSRRKIKADNDPAWGKTIVLGLLERDGKVRAAVAPNRRKHAVHTHITDNVAKGSKIYTDDFNAYDNLPEGFDREFVNHLSAYVRDRVHTNGLENFWSLLKRTLKGTYVSVDPAHLFRYLDEQSFRYNNREAMSDADRFSAVLSQIVGKRVTYAQLIGKEEETKPVA